MHEATIACHLIEAIGRRIDDGEISGAVNRIHVRVGRMTAVVPDNLRHLFALLAEGSAVEGAELEIEEVPVRARCRACGTEFDIEGVRFDCRDCGSSDTDVVSGRELKIVAVEVN
jgi:hydrogenase nickel incorporation protein HypA/HybF